MLSDKEMLEAVPIRQMGWSDEIMCIWMGRFIERQILERIDESKDVQLIRWHTFNNQDKSTWPRINVDVVLVKTHYRKCLAVLIEDDIFGGYTFVCAENKYAKISLTTVQGWARI